MHKRSFKKGEKTMLKKIILLFVFLAHSAFGSDILWEKNYENALVKAKKENKPIFFYISKTTCPPCIKLKKTTFKNKDVIAKLNSEFVSVVAHTDKNEYIPRHLYVPYTPSLWFLDIHGEARYEPLVGAVDAQSFMRALALIKKDFDTNK